MKRRDFVRMIEQAGWVFDHQGGDHAQYRKNGIQFGVPRHTEISPLVERKWRKADQLAEENAP